MMGRRQVMPMALMRRVGFASRSTEQEGRRRERQRDREERRQKRVATQQHARRIDTPAKWKQFSQMICACGRPRDCIRNEK